MRSPSKELTICIYFIFAIITQALAVSYNSSQFDTAAARQIMRLSKSAEMRNYMKPQVDACEDFYEYACGNWAKINPVNNRISWGMFGVMSNAYNRRLLKILDGPRTSEDNEINVKVKQFYESCLLPRRAGNQYRKELISIMEEFGGMPALKGSAWKESEFDWLETVALILRKYGSNIILGVNISPDLSNSEINRLYIGQSDDMNKIGSLSYDHISMEWKIEMQKMLGMAPTQAVIVLKEIIDFAKKLDSGMVKDIGDLQMEDKSRLKLLDDMTEDYGRAINFTHFVKTWLGYEYKLPVYEYVADYIRNLSILVLETPRDILANYIMWKLILNFRLDAKQTLKEQKYECFYTTKTHFIKYLDHLAYKKLLRKQPDIVKDMKSMWLQLKLSFEDILHSSSSDWMHETTKNKALEKLSAMTFEINGYVGVDFEKELSTLDISSRDFFDNLLNVFLLRGRNFRKKLFEPPEIEDHLLLSATSVYSAELNRVIFPVSSLQPRFLWDDAYPKALKYGTVGFIIAHEMAHGFDDSCRKYDANGNINDWWDRNASAVFATRAECLRQQYAQFKFGGKLLPKYKVQGENIADNVGIRIAYAAYEMWLSKHHLTPEHLPHMDTINARQLFFISFAQLWCTDVNQFYKGVMLTDDVHPPEEVRVRGMLANFDAFAETFECQLGSRMHPHKKCIMY